MSFIFYFTTKSSPTHTVTFPSPERDNKSPQIKVQAQARTMSGAIRVYDKGVSRREMELEFQDLTDTMRSGLDHAFDSHANGMVTAFQVDDHHGTLWNARFLQTTLEWVEEGAEILPVTNPLWRLSLKLEVWT